MYCTLNPESGNPGWQDRVLPLWTAACAGATTGKENSTMDEPITLEIFTDYV
jgi:hypothetical protein